MERTLFKLTVIAIAIFLGALASMKVVAVTIPANRKSEWRENEKSVALTETQLHWTIVHIRDDIGSIHNVLVLTNALLAGVIAAIMVGL
jgi:hypothetical protein